MPVYKYFGHPAKYHGKPLFHILCNLKDFGKGRVVTRSVFEKDPSQSELPSFYRILWAQPLMDSDTVEGRVVAEKVKSGVRYTEPVDLASLAPVPDFKLISRQDEAGFCKWEKLRDFSPDVDFVTEPKYFTVPPLLKLLMERNMAERKETPGEESFLLPHYKTFTPKNKEVVTMPDERYSTTTRIEFHQETVTRCEGTDSYQYGDTVATQHRLDPAWDLLSLLPEEPPMPSPAVGMRLYRWPDDSRKHKEEVRTEEHSNYCP
eukprot:GFUD01040830.1.p1 GENE.GFUD01040830.1~~GFUD01040830.1.p1  ORF type:complete len:262 (+),score=80.19 GFUD01040830.1:651-1436(+)